MSSAATNRRGVPSRPELALCVLGLAPATQAEFLSLRKHKSTVFSFGPEASLCSELRDRKLVRFCESAAIAFFDSFWKVSVLISHARDVLVMLAGCPRRLFLASWFLVLVGYAQLSSI